MTFYHNHITPAIAFSTARVAARWSTNRRQTYTCAKMYKSVIFIPHGVTKLSLGFTARIVKDEAKSCSDNIRRETAWPREKSVNEAGWYKVKKLPNWEYSFSFLVHLEGENASLEFLKCYYWLITPYGLNGS